MNITRFNDPANPTYQTKINRFEESIIELDTPGMTKRETIAMHLYAAVLAGHKQEDLTPTGCINLAHWSVQYADALINELNRTAQ